MSLQAFTYPLPETRFLHTGTSVYKFKIRYGSSVRGEEIADKKVVSQELEDSIRAVLGNLDNLQPFTTDHFIIFPYKSKWERVSHLRFKHGATFLEPYPFVCTLYVEMKWAPAGTSGGDNDFPEMPDAPSADCPPALGQGESQGSGSYLKGHNEEAEVRTVAAKRRRLEGGKFPPGREQGRATMGTSGRKKPSAQTRRGYEILAPVLRASQSQKGPRQHLLRPQREKAATPNPQGSHSIPPESGSWKSSASLPLWADLKKIKFNRTNWPGEPASEEEETEDFDTAFLKERGALAGSGSSLGDPKGHPPQTSGPSSPEGPPKPKPAGFWGFLSSLLPFRLFGWRGRQ